MKGSGHSWAWRAMIAAAFIATPLLFASDGNAYAAAPSYEVWLGVLAHDAPIFGNSKEHGPDINAELVLPSPVSDAAIAGIAPAIRWLLQPRPDIGVDGNTAGDTSQAYLGLTWAADLADDVFRAGDALFFDVSVGPGLNNGEISTTNPNRKSLGSHVLIHSSVEVGYRVDPRLSVALYLDHSSDAGLTKQNEGLTDIGVRVGFGF